MGNGLGDIVLKGSSRSQTVPSVGCCELTSVKVWRKSGREAVDECGSRPQEAFFLAPILRMWGPGWPCFVVPRLPLSEYACESWSSHEKIFLGGEVGVLLRGDLFCRGGFHFYRYVCLWCCR